MLVPAICNEDELPTRRGAFDTSARVDQLRLQNVIVGTVDQNARPVGVEGSVSARIIPEATAVAIDVGNQDEGVGDLRVERKARRGDEKGSEDSPIEDVKLIVFPSLVDFEEDVEKILTGGLIAHVAPFWQRDSKGIDAVTNMVELVSHGALSWMLKSQEESI